MTQIMNAAEVRDMLEHLTRQVAVDVPLDTPLAVVGVRTRGEFLALRIRELLTSAGFTDVEFGTVDITLYRDDLHQVGRDARVQRTELLFDVSRRTILLVDDVVYTGRTIRAAMEALMDVGRPPRILLAVLIDRGQRELPIQPDYAGRRFETDPTRRVEVHVTECDGVDEVTVS